MTPDAFVDSLGGDRPPTGATPALQGLWYALRGEWDAAHRCVQPETDDCAWVHAALHREEGDLDNARYWYGQAGRRVSSASHRDEYLSIARQLSGG